MINNVVLVGRITKDPELKKSQSGLSVVSFTLAVNRRKTKDKEQEADFINCVAWRSSADYLANYVRKGTLLGVEGSIQTRNYENQQGQRVYVTEIICDSVQTLYRTQDGNGQANTYAQPQNATETNYGAQEQFERDYIGEPIEIQPEDLPF